jgi:hypothetical protein
MHSWLLGDNRLKECFKVMLGTDVLIAAWKAPFLKRSRQEVVRLLQQNRHLLYLRYQIRGIIKSSVLHHLAYAGSARIGFHQSSVVTRNEEASACIYPCISFRLQLMTCLLADFHFSLLPPCWTGAEGWAKGTAALNCGPRDRTDPL